jgi:hypothetical protein
MMKKISYRILLLSLLMLSTTLSCDIKPKIDQRLEKQVQVDAQGFETLLSGFVTQVSSIKNPGEVDMRPVFPDTWLFEQMPQLYALGIPTPINIRGLVQVSETDNWTYSMIVSNTPDRRLWWYGGGFWGWPFPTIVYFNRAAKLNPTTDTYIVPTWTGQPFYWGNIQGGDSNKRDYPKAVDLDYFKTYKIVTQPYMIPPEATHGVYQEPRSKLSSGSAANLAAVARQMWDANPYLDKSDTERSKTPNLTQLMAQLSIETEKVNNDVTLYLDTINNLENKYFIPNSSNYDKQNALVNYKNAVGQIKTQLSQMNNYLQQIRNWNFINLEKYRSLKTK